MKNFGYQQRVATCLTSTDIQIHKTAKKPKYKYYVT